MKILVSENSLKHIIGTINQLHECLQHGSPTDALNEIFDSLIAYVEFHF